MGLEVGGERPVAVELGLRGLGHGPRRRATAPPPGAAVLTSSRISWAAARRSAVTAPYSSMLSGEELLGATAGEHLQLQPQLSLLGQEQARQRRSETSSHGDLGQPLGRHLGVVLELAVPETGHPPVLLRTAAHLGEVDGREVEQEPEAAGQVGQLAVDREVVGRERGCEVMRPRTPARRAGAAPTPRTRR